MARIGVLTTNHYDPEGKRMIYGGAERYGMELTRLLIELGFEVTWWQVGSGWTKEFIPGVKIRSIPIDSSPYQTMPHLNQAFYEQAADIDYAIYFVTYLAYPQVKEKSISISHGIFWDYPSFDDLLGEERARSEWRRRMWIALNGPGRVVSVDTAFIQWAVSMWPGLVHKFEYIPNFVDTESFTPSEAKQDNKIRILYPRRLTSVRGINEAARVAEILTEKYDNLEVHFVGRGHSDDTERQLFQWAAKHKDIFYYWKPPDGMREVYQLADIVLIPSKSTEGTSLSCLEAMASGKAVVSSYVGGLSNLIIDGYNGLLIRPTVEGILQAAEYLLRNEHVRIQLGRRARETAACFSLNLWKTRWARVIEEIFV